MNRLQFQRTTQLFATRDEALTYIQLNKTSVPAEPIVSMYGIATEPSVILGIGSAIGKYFIIDITKVNEKIDQLQTLINESGDEIIVIQADITQLKTLVNAIITGAGLNSDGTYKQILDTILQNAVSLADADLKLSLAIQNLKQQISDGTLLTTPKISADPNNIIYKDITGDGGIFSSLGLTFDPNTGVLTLTSGKDANLKTYAVNLGLTATGIVNAYYDSVQKDIVIVYEMSDGTEKTVRIPAGELITEWEPLPNYTSSTISTDASAIKMKKTYDSATHKDFLYADVKIDDANPHNILKKEPTNGALYVDSNSDGLSFAGTSQSVTNKINEIEGNINTTLTNAKAYTDTQVANEASARSTGDINTLNSAKQDATDKDNALKTELIQQIVNGDTTTLTNAKTYTDIETVRATTKEGELQTQINTLSAKTVNGSNTGLNNPIYVNNILDVDGNKVIDINLNLSTSTGNLLVKNADGLFVKALINYDTSTGNLNLTDISNNIISQTLIPVASVIDHVEYDAPFLKIYFKLSDGTITHQDVDLTGLINNWDVANSATSGVTLTKTNTGGTGIDILTADVKLQGYDNTNNILYKDVDGNLYVKGTADNIKYDNSNVKTALDTLTTKVNELPLKDTHITKGEVSADGSKMVLYYGTDTEQVLGYIEVPTSVYMDNTDTFITSVNLTGTVLTLNRNDGVSIPCELKTLSDKGVKDGKLNADLQHIDLTLLDNTEIHIDLSGLLSTIYTKSQVDALIPTDYVKKVNNISPDINGNVNVIIPEAVSDVRYDSSNAELIIDYTEGSPSQVINLPKENFLDTVTYDPNTKIITFTMVNGSQFNVSLYDLVQEYTVSASGGLELVNTNQFGVKAGGIVEAMLTNTIIDKLNKVLAISGDGNVVTPNQYIAAINVNDHTISAVKATLPTQITTLTPKASQDVTVSGDLSSVEATINPNTITTNKLVDGAVTNTKLVDGAVTNGKIADSTIALTKLTPEAYQQVTKQVAIIGGQVSPNEFVTGLTAIETGDYHEIQVIKGTISLPSTVGDMLKSVYDTNNDGKVNSADVADAVPFSGITGKPTTLSGYGITDAAPLSHVGSKGVSQHGLGDGTNAGFSTNDFTTTYKNKIDTLPTSVGDMLKSVYDTNGDGRVNSADNASTLQTARNFSITGDVTATAVSFDGSANVALASTLSNTGVTAGTYTKITVDAKGRATVGTSATVDDILGTVNVTVTEI